MNTAGIPVIIRQGVVIGMGRYFPGLTIHHAENDAEAHAWAAEHGHPLYQSPLCAGCNEPTTNGQFAGHHDGKCRYCFPCARTH